MYDLTSFQRDLLFAVAGLETGDSDEKPHGLAIKEKLEEYYNKEVHHGRLYPNLDTLVEKGLIDKGSRDKRTNYYHLTKRGWRELDARRDWQEEQFEGREQVAPPA